MCFLHVFPSKAFGVQLASLYIDCGERRQHIVFKHGVCSCLSSGWQSVLKRVNFGKLRASCCPGASSPPRDHSSLSARRGSPAFPLELASCLPPPSECRQSSFILYFSPSAAGNKARPPVAVLKAEALSPGLGSAQPLEHSEH